jgi:hypothetical protein
MKYRKVALPAFGVLLFTLAGFAQTTALEGSVTAEDGRPLKGAMVVIARGDGRGHYQVRTDRQGHYFYGGLPMGVYRVSVEVDGQERGHVDDVRTAPGGPKEVSFDLHATAEKNPKLAVDQPVPPVALALPSTYVSTQTPADQIQLNADNSFSLQEGGQTYHGAFAVNGNTLELSISETNAKTTVTIAGNNLADPSGQTWVKREQSARPAPAEGALRNQDIIKMAKAGFDDAIIIAKIGSSKCQFDTSTDGLIQLKQSGVSAAVLKAMVGAGK